MVRILQMVAVTAIQQMSLLPAKRKQLDRPTTSREKAPYEGLSKRTRFCGICRQQGHKRTTCPERGDVPKQHHGDAPLKLK
uniref:CCHC-type domain-containing protein n=1 Tax=Aegilops tauschii subsp. strangulata TaxID=200361 RepID=A0A452Z5A8_AEGTS